MREPAAGTAGGTGGREVASCHLASAQYHRRPRFKTFEELGDVQANGGLLLRAEIRMRNIAPWLTLALLAGGCCAIAPDVAFPVSGQRYRCFVGKKYEVISPLIIVAWKNEWGAYWLTPPVTTHDEDTKFITDVPVGSIVVADHVSQGGGCWFREPWTSYIGRLQTHGIFRGGFDLSDLIQWNRGNERAPFCERYAGLDEKYLTEIK